MYRIARSTTVPADPERAFNLIANFANIPVWDPGSVDSELLSGDGFEVGSTFRVTVTFNGRNMPMTYRTVESVRPNRVVLRGKGLTTRAVDTITFAPTADGTRIDYLAELSLRGPLRLVERRLVPDFEALGDAAIDGIAKALGN